MQIKLFTIPVNNTEDYNEDLNKFLRTHKIIEVEKHILQTSNSYSWCFYISYIGTTVGVASSHTDSKKTKKIDYMKVLDAETFTVFSKLREIRKQLSAENAVSAYIVFTDAELAEIAKLKNIEINKIRKIKGIGDKKAEKYGTELLKRFNTTVGVAQSHTDSKGFNKLKK